MDALVEDLAADSLAQAEADQEAAYEEYKKANPLFAQLQPSVSPAGQPYQGPVVGTAHYTDTAKVMAMLNTQVAKSLLPRELHLCWTVKAIDEAEAYYQLVALKSQTRGLCINPCHPSAALFLL